MFHILHNTIEYKYLFNFNYELTVICNNNYRTNKQKKQALTGWHIGLPSSRSIEKNYIRYSIYDIRQDTGQDNKAETTYNKQTTILHNILVQSRESGNEISFCFPDMCITLIDYIYTYIIHNTSIFMYTSEREEIYILIKI